MESDNAIKHDICIEVLEEYLKAFKDGVTDALLEGTMSDHRPDGYKQGYDFGIFLYGCMNEEEE